MRLRADRQLFLSYLILIGALTGAIGFGAGSIVRGHLLETIEDDMRRELNLARATFENLRGAPVDSVADLLGSLSGRRITIITEDGTAVGESAPVVRDRPPADDYRNRPEVRQALTEGAGRGIRYSNTIGADHLYLALVTDRGEVIRAAVPLSEIDETVGQVQRRILVMAGGAVVLAGFFSLGFSLLITRPLRHTVEVARALGSGDLMRRVEDIRDNDFGDLGAALNTLADELQKRLSQLERERAEMQTLIDSMSEGVLALNPSGTLRRSNPAAKRLFSLGAKPEGIPPEMVSRRPGFLDLATRALKGEAVPPVELTGDGQYLLGTAHPLPQGGAVMVFLDVSELRRLEDVRRDFVANASHELKTPLTAIRGYSETLLDPDLEPELVRRFAEIVKTNSDRLQRIVDDLLDLSRIEAGGWRVAPAPVDLRRLVTDVWESERASAPGNTARLQLELGEGQEFVTADPAAIRQILANLLGNALRYTPAAGTVTIRSRPGMPKAAAGGVTADPSPRPWTIVDVTDTGIGISRPHLTRIFERFYRVDPARSREEGGTGLGLAIVKHLVEAHGGWIEAESELGRGTTIRFALPSGSRSGSA